MAHVFKILILIVTLSGCSTSIFTTGVSSTAASHDRRSLNDFYNDQSIGIKASVALFKDRELWNNAHINTLNFNNTLLMVGQVETPELKKRAQSILESIPEIESIYNQLTISKPIPITARSKDTWITTQVKAKLLTNRDIGINRVKVITEDSKVYLMGLLSNEEEQIAAGIASRIKGVTEVIKIVDEFQAT